MKAATKVNGYIDLHTHGIGRFDTRTYLPEEILRIAELHRKKEVSAILPTIYPATITEMRKNMEAVKKAMEIQRSGGRQERGGKRPEQSMIMGIHIEGPYLNPSRCGALDRDFFLRPSVSSLKRLIDGYEGIVKIITIAPELPGALRVIERCREMGIKVNMGHSDATYTEALEGKKAGATGITHIFNAMRPFHHREPGIAGLALIDKDLYVEVIADGVHLSPEVLRILFKVKRAERIIVVSDSVKGAGRLKRPIHRDGILVGSSKAISEGIRILRQIGLSETVIKKTIIDNPIRYVGLP